MNAPPGTIVVAVGGNALAPPGKSATIYEQFRHTRESLGVVVTLARQGWLIAFVHGNAPQVGDALVRNEMSIARVEPLPLGVLVASTAGWIGYMIQQSLQNALNCSEIPREVITVITQTVVRRDDPAARQPRKPIGHQLSDPEVVQLEARGIAVGVDGSGRRRRLAPSPDPIDILEWRAVRQLVEEGKIVIAAGGGGPPVFEEYEKHWEGIDAVVDKDRAAAVLGCRLGADTLLILTDVDGVYRGWGTNAAERVPQLSVEEADVLLDGDELGLGSMRPKVEAAVTFVRGGGRRAVVADLPHGLEALRGETGTTIVGEER